MEIKDSEKNDTDDNDTVTSPPSSGPLLNPGEVDTRFSALYQILNVSKATTSTTKSGSGSGFREASFFSADPKSNPRYINPNVFLGAGAFGQVWKGIRNFRNYSSTESMTGEV